MLKFQRRVNIFFCRIGPFAYASFKLLSESSVIVSLDLLPTALQDGAEQVSFGDEVL